jgi:hypothetical protein
MLQDTLNIKGKVVKVYQEDYIEDFHNPREWDNLGTMAFFHKRYILGDKHDFAMPDDLQEFLSANKVIKLPVYIYDHSGIGISTDNSRYPFNCPWDSGMLGYIFVTYERVKSEYSWKVLTQKRINKIKSYLQAEVDTYNLFLDGRVYWFNATCERCGESDSCGGFYGEDWKENGLIDQNDYYCPCHERAYTHAMGIAE